MWIFYVRPGRALIGRTAPQHGYTSMSVVIHALRTARGQSREVQRPQLRVTLTIIMFNCTDPKAVHRGRSDATRLS